jgi:hypothetical protein
MKRVTFSISILAHILYVPAHTLYFTLSDLFCNNEHCRGCGFDLLSCCSSSKLTELFDKVAASYSCYLVTELNI